MSKLKVNGGFDTYHSLLGLEAGLQDNNAGNNACWETLVCVRRRGKPSPLFGPFVVFSY